MFCVLIEYSQRHHFMAIMGIVHAYQLLRWETGKVVWVPSFANFHIRNSTNFRYAYVRWIFPHFLDKNKVQKGTENIYLTVIINDRLRFF